MKRELEKENDSISPTKKPTSSQFFSSAPTTPDLEVIMGELSTIAQMWDTIMLNTTKEFAKGGETDVMFILPRLKHNLNVIDKKYGAIERRYFEIDLREKLNELSEQNKNANKISYALSRLRSIDLQHTLVRNMKDLGQEYLKEVVDILNNLYKTNSDLLARFTKVQHAIRELVLSKDVNESDENLRIVYNSLKNFDKPLKEIKTSHNELIRNLKAKIKIVAEINNPIANFIYNALIERLELLKESRQLVRQSYTRCVEEIRELKMRIEKINEPTLRF